MPLDELRSIRPKDWDVVLPTYDGFIGKESILSQELYALWIEPSIIIRASCTLFPYIEILISL